MFRVRSSWRKSGMWEMIYTSSRSTNVASRMMVLTASSVRIAKCGSTASAIILPSPKRSEMISISYANIASAVRRRQSSLNFHLSSSVSHLSLQSPPRARKPPSMVTLPMASRPLQMVFDLCLRRFLRILQQPILRKTLRSCHPSWTDQVFRLVDKFMAPMACIGQRYLMRRPLTDLTEMFPLPLPSQIPLVNSQPHRPSMDCLPRLLPASILQ